MKKRKNKGAAFTLIELLIVVAIIGILAAIAVPNFLNAQVRAKIARAVSNMRTASTALEQYFLDNNSYTAWAWDSTNPATHYRGFRSLTTPIPYATSLAVFYNPFKSNTQKGLTLADGRELDPYFELGTWLAKSEKEFVVQIPNNVWLLESSGPDSGDDYNAGNFPVKGLVYQPSNGLFSRGDLFRGGGVRLPGWASALTY
ncbi:MAG: prepilin-type N-terminal cleavage/methylation domain-containing protein [Candidatus Omnitrophota bacterium]